MCEDYVLGSSAPWLRCLLWFIFPTESSFSGAYLFRLREKTFALRKLPSFFSRWRHLLFCQKICVHWMSSLCKIYSCASPKDDLSFDGIELGSLQSESRCSYSEVAGSASEKYFCAKIFNRVRRVINFQLKIFLSCFLFILITLRKQNVAFDKNSYKS